MSEMPKLQMSLLTVYCAPWMRSGWTDREGPAKAAVSEGCGRE